MQFDANRPIYLQLMEAIKLPALRGELAPGAALKSVRAMARDMGVNPNTMARAFNELEREGFIATHRGTGSFITTDMAMIGRERERLVKIISQRFLAEIAELGLNSKEMEELLKSLGSQAPKAVDTPSLQRKTAP